jgi:hypothetical protein
MSFKLYRLLAIIQNSMSDMLPFLFKSKINFYIVNFNFNLKKNEIYGIFNYNIFKFEN